jgi:hypothetical protein
MLDGPEQITQGFFFFRRAQKVLWPFSTELIVRLPKPLIRILYNILQLFMDVKLLTVQKVIDGLRHGFSHS